MGDSESGTMASSVMGDSKVRALESPSMEAGVLISSSTETGEEEGEEETKHSSHRPRAVSSWLLLIQRSSSLLSPCAARA